MLSTQEDSAMSDFSRSHKRHHEYTYRLPTPPRIVVPPPTLTTDMPNLHVRRVTDNPDVEIDTRFLKEMDLESVVQKNTLLEWSYERRRQAQKILPWLYLGPLTAAKDKEFLSRENITMVLAVRAKENSMNGAVQVARTVCHEVATIEAATNYMLTGNFIRATRMINLHMVKMRQLATDAGEPRLGKVLVFCESGNDKSAAVVAAYLMDLLDDFDHVKSMQVCQAQRFCVNFDDSIKNILRSHWDILQAKRAVASSRVDHQPSPLANGHHQAPQHLQVHSSMPKVKRSIEETRDDDDIEMGDGMDPSDILRFEGRANTPFQDS